MDAQRLVGSVVTDVPAGWHMFHGDLSDVLVGLWLTLSGIGSVAVTTSGDRESTTRQVAAATRS